MDSIGSIDTAVATMTNFIYIFWFLLFLCIDQNLLKPLICQQQTRTFPVESTDNSEITDNSRLIQMNQTILYVLILASVHVSKCQQKWIPNMHIRSCWTQLYIQCQFKDEVTFIFMYQVLDARFLLMITQLKTFLQKGDKEHIILKQATYILDHTFLF